MILDNFDVFSSFFVLPPWLQDLACVGTGIVSSDRLSDGQIKAFPAFTPKETDGVLAQVATLQDGLLGAKTKIEINLDQYRRSFPYTSKQDLQALHSAFIGFQNVIFLPAHSHCPSNVEVSDFRLFDRVSWRFQRESTLHGKLPEGPEEITVTINDSQRLDFLVGLTTPFRISIQQITNDGFYAQYLKTFLEPSHHLFFLDRHLWFDLTQLERRLYLQMERQIQKQSRWLDLEGHFFIDFVEHSAHEPNPTKAYQQLVKLVKKMSDHGLVEAVDDHCYLAFPSSEKNTQQAGSYLLRRRLDSAPVQFYQDYESKYHNNIVLPSFISNGLTHLQTVYSIDSQIMNNVRGYLEYCTKTTPPDSESHPMFTRLRGTTLLSFTELLCDWYASYKSRKFDQIWRNEAGVFSIFGDSFLHLDHGRFDEARLDFASKFLSEKHDILEMVDTIESFFCISMVSLQKNPSTIYQQLQTLVKQHQNLKEVLPKTTAPSNSSLTSEADASSSSSAERSAVNASATFNLRKIAADELERMRATENKTQYKNLVRVYQKSLSTSRQNVLSELQQTLSAAAFDTHIKQNLIRFMVENPFIWSANHMQIHELQRNEQRL